MSAPPVRTCVGCRRRAPAGQLGRVVRYPDGLIGLDRLAAGRGAWLCRDPTGVLRETCVSQAVRRSALERALRAPLAPGALEALRGATPGRARMDDATGAHVGHRGRD